MSFFELRLRGCRDPWPGIRAGDTSRPRTVMTTPVSSQHVCVRSAGRQRWPAAPDAGLVGPGKAMSILGLHPRGCRDTWPGIRASDTSRPRTVMTTPVSSPQFGDRRPGGRAAGRPGGRAAGRPGGRAAGRPSRRVARRPGRRVARRPGRRVTNGYGCGGVSVGGSVTELGLWLGGCGDAWVDVGADEMWSSARRMGVGVASGAGGRGLRQTRFLRRIAPCLSGRR